MPHWARRLVSASGRKLPLVVSDKAAACFSCRFSLTSFPFVIASSQRRITPDVIGRFGKLLRDRLRADNPALRQAYTRLLISEVTVEAEKVQIRGSRRALERAVLATAATGRAKVPSFAREWRTRQDSNLWPLPSEGNALSS